MCMGIAREVFDVGDDALRLLDETPPDAVRPKIEDAVERCPKQAIRLEDGGSTG